jgi:peptidoglycan biosynthesis protein MviN/MurJ (putative lipid II flippase)
LIVLSWGAIEVAFHLQPRPELRELLSPGRAAGVAIIPMVAVISSVSAGVLIGRNRYPLVCAGLVLRTATAVTIVLLRPFGSPFPDLLCAFLAGEVVRSMHNVLTARRVVLAPVSASGASAQADPWMPSLAEVWRTTWPVSLSMMAAALSPIVDRIIAAGIMPGGVSLIEYGEKAYFLGVGTVVAGLQVTVLSRWSMRHEDPRSVWQEFKELSMVLAAAGVLLAPLLFLSGHLVAPILMGRRLVTGDPATATLTGFYLVAIVPYTVGGLAIRALMARRDSRPILVLGAAKLGVNVVGDLALTAWLGLPGIALATVAAESCVALGALHFVRRSFAGVRT